MQSQSMQADPSLRTSFIVGFAMHRLMRELFVQTLTLSTLGTIFSRRHFEIFFSFFQENIICTSCKLSPLHETSNPVFLVMKRKKKENEFNLSSAELAQKTLSRQCARFIQYSLRGSSTVLASRMNFFNFPRFYYVVFA